MTPPILIAAVACPTAIACAALWFLCRSFRNAACAYRKTIEMLSRQNDQLARHVLATALASSVRGESGFVRTAAIRGLTGSAGDGITGGVGQDAQAHTGHPLPKSDRRGSALTRNAEPASKAARPSHTET